jgi:hypothetical protein
MTDNLVKEDGLVIRSPGFVYAGEDGQQRQYDIVLADPPRGLASRMWPFYQIEKHVTEDGIAYIGRIYCPPYIDENVKIDDNLGNRGAVLLDANGRPAPLIVNGRPMPPRIFDDIDGDTHLSATLMTATHKFSYRIKPDGTIEGLNYRHPHRDNEVLEQYSGREEIEGVGLSSFGLSMAMCDAEQEDQLRTRERSRKTPLADFIKYKRGEKNEKGK